MINKHNFKKKYGQNFLQEKSIIEKIVSFVMLKEDDLVIEIGPGEGALTEYLCQKARVVAYEIDLDLKNTLTSKFANKNVTFIWDDFLKRNILNDISEYKYNNLYIIANLPYYITTPIITKIIESKIDVSNIIVMVQNEVADRFSCLPGSKDYSSITVFLNYYYNVKKILYVDRKYFYPVPNVDSAIISLTPIENNYNLKSEEIFFKLIKDCFRFKRKTLRNNLFDYDLDKVSNVLNKYNLDLSIRAENIPIEVFIDISNNL